MKFQAIASELELNSYLQKTHLNLGIQFPAEYFNDSKVLVSYENGEIVAGFALILNAPFRVLSSIPEEYRADIHDVLMNSSVEITGFWVDERYRSKLGIVPLLEALSSELAVVSQERSKQYAVYAYDIDQMHLRTIYKRGKPVSLFEGHTIQQVGMPKSKVECIEYQSINTLREVVLTKYARQRAVLLNA